MYQQKCTAVYCCVQPTRAVAGERRRASKKVIHTGSGISYVQRRAERSCWTYSHHCQIGDKNPSKRWNGEFRGFRICVGWISTTGFCVVGFMCLLISVYFVSLLSLLSLFRLPRRGLPRPIYTARAITPLPPLHGYHACLFPGYHAIVICSIPGLSHLSYHAPPHTYIGLSHPP